ncbi:DDE superfamily endonuclease domain [Phytophthora cactorum]|nr:DDE superfamily endonuclease domain [Phytophthora cactorum]
MPNACSGCNGDTSGVSHTCDLCGNRNHTFCGVPVGKKHGGHLRQRVLTEFVGKAATFEGSGTVLDFTTTADCEGKEEGSNEEFLDSDGPVESTDDGDNTNKSTFTTNWHRAPQTVALLTDKDRIVQYMQTLYGEGKTRLPSKAVALFPRIFTEIQKANLQKASRWWKEREKHTTKKRNLVVKVQTGVKTKRMRLKVTSGRGHPHNKRQVEYMDTASGHKVEECKYILKTNNMRVKVLPPNSTHLCQPADSFIIKAIKDTWTSEWDKEKLRLAQDQCFSAGKGKKKASAMLQCGLPLGLNGLWQESQLSEHLQAIVQKYRDDFDGNRTEILIVYMSNLRTNLHVRRLWSSVKYIPHCNAGMCVRIDCCPTMSRSAHPAGEASTAEGVASFATLFIDLGIEKSSIDAAGRPEWVDSVWCTCIHVPVAEGTIWRISWKLGRDYCHNMLLGFAVVLWSVGAFTHNAPQGDMSKHHNLHKPTRALYAQSHMGASSENRQGHGCSLNGCDLENGGQEFVGEILVIRLVIGDGENGSGSEDRDTRTEGEGDGVEQKEERQGVRAEVERLEERRRAATGSHPWFARDEANKDDVTAEEQEQSAFGTGPWPRQSEIMGELLATGDEDEFADAAKGSNVASPRRGRGYGRVRVEGPAMRAKGHLTYEEETDPTPQRSSTGLIPQYTGLEARRTDRPAFGWSCGVRLRGWIRLAPMGCKLVHLALAMSP